MTENLIIYYYPKNLRAKTQTLLWDFSSFMIILILIMSSLILFNYTESGNWLLIPFVFAFLTIKIDNITVFEKISQMAKYTFLPVDFRNYKKQNSTQKLIGFSKIEQEGIFVTNTGSYAMWEISPYNLSVMSQNELTININKLTVLLSQCPNLEIMALDATSTLENNLLYLKSRISSEQNPKIRKLLELDYKEISSLAASANTTRRYLFVMKLPRNNGKNMMRYLLYEKSMEDLGFKVQRLNKEGVKTVIANMLDCVTPIPDYDGLQYIKEESFDEF